MPATRLRTLTSDSLNYTHLLYFRAVAHAGSISAAVATLGVAQATISEQLKVLQHALGVTLFTRRGRGIVLTAQGHVVLRYADEIFTVGRDLIAATRSEGVADVLPKLTAMRLLAPAMRLGPLWHSTVRTDRTEHLIQELAIGQLDLFIADAPLPASARVRAYSHLLGDSGISVFAAADLARELSRDFPRSLNHAPLLLPRDGAALRRSVDAWCHAHRVMPDIVAEVDDMGLLQLLGQARIGAFCAPTVVREEVEHTFDVVHVGALRGARERFYAVTTERTLRHPAVVAIADAARHRLARVRADRRA
jgi:LysR family transcriptional regulator, transcriptional activator of nhaA